MEISLLKVLLENISSLILLSSREDLSYEPARKYYHRIEEILKLLKSSIDAVVDSNINPEEPILEACGELGQSVLGLRELLMNWNPLMSKVYFVLQIEVLISKTQTTGAYIFNLLKSSDHLPLELNASSLKISAQKIKQIDGVQASDVITRAIGEQEDGLKPTSEILAKISDYLSLNSNQEILIEAVALDKLKVNAEEVEKTDEVEFINKLIFLITHMHERLVTMKQAQSSNPVSIPSDFCCPLSLDLMTDPVIVASGQTYERTYFQKWIDLGLTTCPKTRQPLSNTNLVPNYNVKALIANWCEIHNVKLVPDPMKSLNSTPSFGSNINFQLSSDPPPSKEGSLSLKNNLDRFESSGKRHLESDNHISGFGETDESSSYGHNRSASIDQTIWHSPSNLSGVEAQVKNHIEELHSDSIETQREATYQIRLLAKQIDNRIIIAKCGAIEVLVNLLLSTDLNIQEHAVTALLNLSIDNNNKTTIASADAIEPLIHVLETGSPEAKGNSAATLYSLSVMEENKVMIGRSRAIIPLVDLLGNGTPRGKRDAAIALFNLSILHENKARIVEAGAVKYLMELMEPAGGMVDKAVAVLSNLSTIPEGRAAVCLEGGIPFLVEVVELGSARGKEHAAAALLYLCVNSNRFCNMVLQEGAVPPLVALSQSGTPRAKEKARALLNYFRKYMHSVNGRG